jgi:hypothetical protein
MKSSIKKIAVIIYSCFEHIGRARAAGVFARAGNFEAANALMSADKKLA